MKKKKPSIKRKAHDVSKYTDMTKDQPKKRKSTKKDYGDIEGTGPITKKRTEESKINREGKTRFHSTTRKRDKLKKDLGK